jgi:SAM-dependent methyltransferase
MSKAEIRVRERFVDSRDPAHRDDLLRLSQRMEEYYCSREYHSEWITGINANWRPGSHSAQIAMCERIPPGSRVLEVGCGDGSCAREMACRVPGIRYVGMDLNSEAWKGQTGFEFIRGSADALPFPDGSFDMLVSMFVVEHLVFPAKFLDEAWRVLRQGGRLLTVAPDFLHTPMASEEIGCSYGAGREKLRGGRILDALLTAYDTRWRIARARRRRDAALRRGACSFPILLTPRCLRLPGFVPDCDAVYPACPEELVNYLRKKPSCGNIELFFRDKTAFGLLLVKDGAASAAR